MKDEVYELLKNIGINHSAEGEDERLLDELERGMLIKREDYTEKVHLTDIGRVEYTHEYMRRHPVQRWLNNIFHSV
ncbi:MAG TPA: hypothetical protein VMC80_03380 [Patescibacteria group bacterium]|nr:hypothetical protein [Patescibacteria group bacterium]